MFIIENAYLIDGLNNPPCITQVKVEDNRIVEIGENLERDSHSIIDAEGHAWTYRCALSYYF